MILGAGIAGSAVATLISLQGFSVYVFEKGSEEARSDERGEMLPPEALRLLNRFIHKDEFTSVGQLAYARASAWGTEQLHHKSFLTSVPGYALQIDKTALKRKLREKSKQEGASIIFNERFVTGERKISSTGTDHLWQLKIKRQNGDIREVSAKLVIDATGRSRAFTRKFSRVEKYDRLTAIAATLPDRAIETTFQPEYSSLVEPVEDGWWFAALPRNGLGFFARFIDANGKNIAPYRSASSLIASCKDTQYIGDIIQKSLVEPIQNPVVYPASSTKLSALFGAGWIAVGDAAFTVDPLSSHGIYNALDHAALLHEHVMTYPDPLIDLSPVGLKFERLFGMYMELRDRTYSLEKRWQNSEFWSLRRP